MNNERYWIQDYITEVPPILMRDPFLEILGQVDKPIPYTYADVVKFAGHSCVTVAGAWAITSSALKALYPDEIPVRGQIKIIAPAAEDEAVTGVFGEVISFITGAAAKSGFPGGGFGREYNRRNLIEYPKEFTGVHPLDMIWIFERIDTGAKVSVKYDSSKVLPPAKKEHGELTPKIGARTATAEETKEWVEAWNNRAQFVLKNYDTSPELITVTYY